MTDPPYALVSISKRFGKDGAAPSKVGATGVYARASSGFMGKSWDTGERAFAVEFWAEIYRVLKPGGFVVAFSATRTIHRLTCAIEDAGFEIRDMIAWLYGSGFPKSHDVSKAIDKHLGAERTKVVVDAAQVRNPKATAGGRDGMEGATRPWIEAALERGYHEKDSDDPATPEGEAWRGWGTALKPAIEPITVARKPLIGTVAENVLAHGTGAMNIDACRIGGGEPRQTTTGGMGGKASPVLGVFARAEAEAVTTTMGRWPANVVHDASEEVAGAFPQSESAGGTVTRRSDFEGIAGNKGGAFAQRAGKTWDVPQDAGSAARFFFSAKAGADDRIGSKHPTVKPVDLMRWLVRLVTPPKVRELVCETCHNPPCGAPRGNNVRQDVQALRGAISEQAQRHDFLLRDVPACGSSDPANAMQDVRRADSPSEAGLLFPGVLGAEHEGSENSHATPVQALRPDVHSEEGRGADLLFPKLCGDRERAGQTQKDEDGARIHCNAGTGQSDGVEAGLRDGAPLGDGEAPRTAVAGGGGGASHQRGTGRQQDRKSTGHAEGGSRSTAEADNVVSDPMPLLRGDAEAVQYCAKCGGRLAWRERPGIVLDPFAGSGTTGEAAFREGFNAILCERDPEYLPDIARRIELALAGPAIRRAERAKARGKAPKPAPLFGEES
nr:DNA methyltransferase [Methylobacterium frigidaeris]